MPHLTKVLDAFVDPQSKSKLLHDVLSLALIRRNAPPEKAEMDAHHVAIAAVNGTEYLLTWNCTHIANLLTAQQLSIEPARFTRLKPIPSPPAGHVR